MRRRKKISTVRRTRRPSGGAVAALILLAGIVLLFLILRLARPLALLIVATAIAAALAPAVELLERRMPRTLAVILIYLILLIFLVFIFWGIIPTVVEQFRAAIDAIPAFFEQAEQILERWGSLPDLSFFDLVSPALTEMGTSLVALPIALGSAFFEMVMIFVISVYLLMEAPKLRRFFLGLFPESYQGRVEEVVSKMAQAMGGFVQGTILTAVIVGFLTYLGMVILDIDFPLVLGLLAGVLEIIPNLGPILAAIPMVFIALLDSPTKALLAVGFVIILQQLESHIIMPNIMRSRIQISPLLIILAVLAGGALGGLLGIISAIPLVAALAVLFEEVVAPLIRDWLGTTVSKNLEKQEPAPSDSTLNRSDPFI